MKGNSGCFSRRAFLGGAAFFGLATVVNPMLAFATPTSAEKQAEADAVRMQLDVLQGILNQASDNYYQVLLEYDQAVAAMEAAQARIDEANGQIAGLQDRLGTRVRVMYRNGSASFLDVLFGSSTFEELVTNWDLLNNMNTSDAEVVAKTKELRAQVEAEKEEFARQKAKAQEKATEAAAIKKKAEEAAAQMQAVLDSLDAEARELLEQERQAAAETAARAQQDALEREQPSQNGGFTGGTAIPAKGSIVDYAISRLGCPYVWADAGPDSFDCSGLTMWCYAQIGIYIPHNDGAQKAHAYAHGAVLPLSEALPGDILWTDGHVGICTQAGGGQYIHAPQQGDVVKYSTWNQFVCALRF